VSRVGVVVIGRNEGERLRRCFTSLRDCGAPLVYVDSGSSDGSPALARAAGAIVVELDPSEPFTAARARNAGFERLLATHPDTDVVQFVDGDSEMVGGWLERAARELAAKEAVAVVFGRIRELAPRPSIYSRLFQVEWDGPVGDVKACGGNAMMRSRAFRDVGEFNPTLIAGEDPEMCVRLRRRGWRILRIDSEMSLHDSTMTRFAQWWRRTLRCGYSFAAGAALHGRSPERHRVHETRSVWFWGLLLPLTIIGLSWWTRGLSLVLAGAYPALAWRIAQRCRSRGIARADAWLYAAFCVLGKLPECIGQLRYFFLRGLGRRGGLIEYKHRAASEPP